jgi:hypothetical protein
VVDGLRDAVDPVPHHALALQRDQRQRQLAVEVLARLHLVPAIGQEELRPVGETAFVQGRRIRGVQLVDLQLQQQAFVHAPITLRQ